MAPLLTHVLSGLTLALALHGPEETDPAIPRIIEVGLHQSRVMEHLDVLCNDIGPRLTSSRNLQHACEVTRGWLEEWGLDNAHLETWGEFAVGFDRGPRAGRMVAPEALELVFGTNSWSPGTNGPVQGPLRLAPTTDDELAAAGDGLAGAWVLGRSPAAESAQERREFQDRLGQHLAAVGALGLIRSARGELITTFGSHRIEWNELPTDVGIVLIRSQFEDLERRLNEGQEVTLEFDIQNTFVEGPIQIHNVIADIPGSEFPDEYVIVGGHLDSWDGASGTTDNGTGASTTLEAARILATSGARPRRTIRFILWSGEEQGLFGSKGYVRDHEAEMEKVSAVFVHDGGTNYVSGIQFTEAMKEDFEKVFAPAMTLQEDMPFALKPVEGLRGGSSDHDSYLAAGVPGFFWEQDGRAVYRDTWHTHKDHYEAAIPEYQRHSATVIALAAYGVANLDHLLSREKLMAPRRERRRMGIRLGEDGLTVDSVMEGTLAEQAGWQSGDRLIQIDDQKIENRGQLMEAVQAGEPVKILAIQRGQQTLRFKFDWAEQKATAVDDV